MNICVYIQISYGLKFSYRNKVSSSHVYFFTSYICININKYVWAQVLGFPGGSEGKESACSAGEPGSIPRSGRSPGEGIGYPLQYSCLENSMDRGAWQATVHGVTKSRTQLSNFHSLHGHRY